MTENTGVKYVGVADDTQDLFEGQFRLPDGMLYNSYLIEDEKIAVMDTVDAVLGDEWLKNVATALSGKTPDYLVVHHMEPDHSAYVAKFLEIYPEAKVVATKQAFAMMKSFFGKDFSSNGIAVGDGDTLSLGKRELKFFTAPMVHWPEVAVSYDTQSKTLFSADAFGKFGKRRDTDDWACEARRYYFGIVGKYGVQVQALLKKIGGLTIKRICPLHGPILENNLSYYIDLYNVWSSYGVESEGIAIAYTSVYGHTEEAVKKLAETLKANGCPKVAVSNLIEDDMAEAVEDAFRYGTLVLATTTYNADIFPTMKTFIEALEERNYQNRTLAFIENGTWAPIATKKMRALTEKFANVTYADTTVTVRGALSSANEAQIVALAKELC